MATEDVKRKLTAIFSADVVGYSRLMGEDEVSTVRTLEGYREIMVHYVMQYRGRVVDSPGDNLLAEFASAVDAVNCAVEVQRELAEKNAELPSDRKMEYRIGINVGDVIQEGNRIYGDGVNIAARIESLADPTGISISGTVYNQVKNKLKLEYRFVGKKSVKNIKDPVPVYRVLSYPGAAAHRVTKARRSLKRTWLKAAIAAIVVVLVIAVIAFLNFYLRRPPIEPASVERMAYPLSDKPSIAVLPFVNMSGDPEQEYFSDGITEDIITNLSKVSGLFVISRNSTFLYKGKQVKIEDVAKDLGVHYVLEGSVRRGGNRVRITAQLIDGQTEHHVWADSYDRELKDIFSVQDDVTQKVVAELAVALTATETERMYRKHTENFEAYDLYLRALRMSMAVGSKEKQLNAVKLFERVIELDPNFAGGYANISFILSRNVRNGFSDSPREDLAKAYDLAQKAVSTDDTFTAGYEALASVYLTRGQQDEALAAARTALTLVPGDAQAYLWLGFYLHWAGRGEEAVEAIKKARQLNPKYLEGRNPWYLTFMGFACFTAGLYEEASDAMKQCIDRYGPNVPRQSFLIASYIMLGRDEEARATAHQFLKINPKFTLKSWKLARMYKNPEDTERLLNALRKAGLESGGEK